MWESGSLDWRFEERISRARWKSGIKMRDPRLPAYQAWLPPSLLPTRPQLVQVTAPAIRTDQEAKERVVAWRLHLSGITATGLPNATEFGRLDWMGYTLRLTTTWSGESRRTSQSAAEGGSHSWAGEHATLSMPPVASDGVPESEVDVALCARVVGRPDEVVGAAKVSIASRSGAVAQLALLGPVFKGITPTVSFRFDVTGVTRAQVEREAGIGGSHDDEASSSSGRTLIDPSRQPPVHSFSSTSLLPSSSGGGGRPASAGVPRSGGTPTVDGYTWRPSASAGSIGGGKPWLVQPTSSEGLAAVPTSERSARQQQQFGAFGARGAEAPPLPPRASAPPPAAPRVGFGTAIPPPAPPAAAAPKAAGKGAGKDGKAAPPPAGPPRPKAEEAWMRPISAPSARLLMQLDECARIKAAFVKAGLPCPTRAVERALLLPEDRPALLCLSALPQPGPEGQPLPTRDTGPVLGKGKKGKGGKGKGKGKGGKKKK